jgi:spermidine synthase
VIGDETAPATAPPATAEEPDTAVGGVALHALVLCAGACSLATEMAGARLLAPYFGTSNVVWANVIGLILVYLSLGYWLGGRLADRHPTPRALGRVVLGAALAIGVLPFATRPLFSAAADAFANVSAGAFVASFLGTMLMFALPVTALGAVSPWAIRLAVTDVREAGTVAGRLYALSTVGSIAGTFGPVLVLIPWLGTQRTLLGAALLLALAALPVSSRRALAVPAVLALLFAVPPGLVKAARDGRVLFEGESPYQFVQVVRERSGDVVLHLNEGWAVHSVLPAHGVLTGGYWDAFLTLPLLDGRPGGRVAVLGNAGGTVANLFAAAWPSAHVDGVELDPLVSDVGRRYLGMGRDRNLAVHTADGRFWLAGNPGPFDAIVVDAYRQPYIPFHLVSREFFELVRRRLGPHGVVAINVGTPPKLTAVVRDIAATMRAAFPAVQSARYDDFNSILIGYRDPADAAAASSRLRAARGLPAVPGRRLAPLLATVRPGGEVLTDDRAPIEWLTDRALLDYLREGAPGA